MTTPYLPLSENLFGIMSLFQYRPETAKPIRELAQILLRGESTLTELERELIGTYVSKLNECNYCYNSHKSICCTLGSSSEMVEDIMKDTYGSPISDKMKALLDIAKLVTLSGKNVRPEHISLAKEYGATDREIHDTVLIAALFCMCNRYVDGLATNCPSSYELPPGMSMDYL